MANIKSNKKSNKQSIKKNEINKSYKSKVKTAIKKAEKTKEEADKNYAVSLIDKSVSKGIYKKNKASRLKSKIHHITVN